VVDLVVKNQDLFLSVEEPQVFNKQASGLLPLHTLFDPKQYTLLNVLFGIKQSMQREKSTCLLIENLRFFHGYIYA
jgi:hypothetical protein